MPKIALVAISGVRVKDKEIAAFGLTLPGFVERSKVIASLPTLGLLTIASYIPNHWHCEYIEASESTDQILAQLSDFDIIAISALSARIEDAHSIVLSVRHHERSAPIERSLSLSLKRNSMPSQPSGQRLSSNSQMTIHSSINDGRWNSLSS